MEAAAQANLGKVSFCDTERDLEGTGGAGGSWCEHLPLYRTWRGSVSSPSRCGNDV